MYHLSCHADTPIKPMMKMLKQAIKDRENIIFISGRGEVSKETTIQWFYSQGVNISESQLYLRPIGDSSSNVELKLKYVKQIGKTNISKFYDDNIEVINAMKKLKIDAVLVEESSWKANG
jgi:hypothetical protein